MASGIPESKTVPQMLVTSPKRDDDDDKKITRACEMCRKKKIKCDWVAPKCGPCSKFETNCIYLSSMRALRREKKNLGRAEKHESRLSRTERLLQCSGLPLQSPLTPSKLAELEAALIQTSDSMNNTSSSASHSCQITPAHFTPRSNANLHERNDNSIRRNELTPLPPLHEALPIIDFYFHNLNQLLPLFDRTTFMELIMQHYHEGIRVREKAIWACINVVLTLGHRLLAMASDEATDDHARAMEYLNNTLAVAPEIALYGSTLLDVQAIVGLCNILQGTSTPRSFSMFVAGASRLIQHLGIHKEVTNNTVLASHEIEQQRRVFWITNIFDKGIGIRTGVPPCLDLDDSDISLPKTELDDGLGCIYLNDQVAVDMFELRTRLSIYDGLIYKLLYSTNARSQPPEARTSAVAYLDAILLNWRTKIPISFTDDEVSARLPRFARIHLAILHSFYFHALTMVHREPALLHRIDSKSSIQRFDPMNFSSSESCLVAARELMCLLGHGPKGDYAAVWLILYSAVSALTTLLHHVIHRPHLPTAESDLQCVAPLIDDILPALLANYKPGVKAVDEEVATDLGRMHTFVGELRRRAVISLQKWNYLLVDQSLELEKSISEIGVMEAEMMDWDISLQGEAILRQDGESLYQLAYPDVPPHPIDPSFTSTAMHLG